MKLDSNLIADLHLIGGADDVAVRVVSNGVASFEDAERAAFLELGAKTIKAQPRSLKTPSERLAQAGGKLVGALAVLPQKVIEAAEAAMSLKLVETGTAGKQYEAHVLNERAAELLNVTQEFIARAHHDFRGV